MGYRWRKAVILSVALHLFLWGVAGYVSAHRQVLSPAEEKMVELDVVDVPYESTKEPQEEQPVIPPSPPQPEPKEVPAPETPPPPLAVSDSDEEKTVEKVVETSVNGKNVDEPVVVNNNKPKAKAMGTPPVVLFRAYPTPEEQGDFKGTVVLKVQILENGIPGNIEIAVTSGTKRINDAAIAAAKKWRFKPALDHEGHPMVCTTIMSIPFNKK